MSSVGLYNLDKMSKKKLFWVDAKLISGILQAYIVRSDERKA